MVSILVFLDGALKGYRHSGRRPNAEVVSILVFLDGALKDHILIPYILPYNGFNPCFSGWRSESVGICVTYTLENSFNPCFSGWRSESSPHSGESSIFLVSILVFLDGALKADKNHSTYSSKSVSILVFLDGALKACMPFSSFPLFFSFNPCFSGWRSESCVICGVLVTTNASFNPCFSGWRSESRLQPSGPGLSLVSILVFLDGALKGTSALMHSAG